MRGFADVDDGCPPVGDAIACSSSGAATTAVGHDGRCWQSVRRIRRRRRALGRSVHIWCHATCYLR